MMEQGILKAILTKNGITKDGPVHKFTGGQINNTYLAGSFVVKIQKDLDVLMHQPELIEKLITVGAKVPRLVDSGVIEGKQYLVMEKIPGKKLSEIWFSLSFLQKEHCIAQICEQLMLFHSIHFEKYSTQRPKEFDNFLDAWKWQANFDLLKGKDFDDTSHSNIQLLKDSQTAQESAINETGTAVLVHNDFHFENVLFEGDILTSIIDFDFARQAPRDYELWHLLDFFNTPVYFVEEELEPLWKNFVATDEVRLFKKHYASLFSHEHLLERIRLYFMDDIISRYQTGPVSRANQQVERYYKSDWLKRQIL